MAISELWYYFWLYFPLGIIGVWRWAVWLFKTTVASFYRPASPESTSPGYRVSVVVPVYQEDPKVFREALGSMLVNKVD